MTETDDKRYNFFYHLGNYMTNMVNVDLDDREEKVRGYFLGKISEDEKTIYEGKYNSCEFNLI